MIKLFYSIIWICLYFIVCIYIYIGYSQLQIKRKKTKFIKKDKTIGVTLSTALATWKAEQKISEDSIQYIKKAMKRKISQEYVCDFFLKKVKEDEESVITFIRETNVLQPVLEKGDKSEFDIAYKLKLIGRFKVENYDHFLLNNCKSNSIYIQINALHSLSRLGDVTALVLGLKSMLASDTLIDMKVISDKISKFTGDKLALNNRLERELTNGDIKLNKVILEHFIHVGYTEAKVKLLKLLNEPSIDKELRLACIKYFIKMKDVAAKEVLIQLLQDESWEIRALSATALKHYQEQEVRLALKDAVKDENWYVRQNVARTLFHVCKTKKEIIDIINGQDKYASDAILSILSEEGCLEEYLYGIKIEEDVKKRLERLVTKEAYFVESLV